MYERYKFIDESWFKLTCGHYSEHIQCLISFLIWNGVSRLDSCPIADKKKCQKKSFGCSGDSLYWGTKSYHSFVSAFLRNRALVDAFVDKLKLAEFNQYN